MPPKPVKPSGAYRSSGGTTLKVAKKVSRPQPPRAGRKTLPSASKGEREERREEEEESAGEEEVAGEEAEDDDGMVAEPPKKRKKGKKFVESQVRPGRRACWCGSW